MSLNIHLRNKKNEQTAKYPDDYVDICISGHLLNVTHNCGHCASKVCLRIPERVADNIYIFKRLTLYDVLWHGNEHNIIQAKDIILYVKEGLNILINNTEYYSQFDPENHWGDVWSLINFCILLLNACKNNPYTYLEFSR